MAVSIEVSAPYAPPSAILDIIDRYRNMGLTRPFTADVLVRAGVSESLIPRTLQALTVLELIDDEKNPTETLEGLRRAPGPEFKKQLAAWISSVYADVMSFVEASDDESAIRDAFRSYKPHGQQTRMVTLFLGLCRAAGLREDDQSTAPSRPRARTSRAASKPRSPPKTQQLASTEISRGLPPAIAGLIKSLPESGTWTADRREKFIKTFTAVLDFSIRVVEKKEEEADASEEHL